MNDSELLSALKIVTQSLTNTNINWRVEGSSNLRVQDVETNVNDLDITTTKNFVEQIKTLFKQYLSKDYFHKETNTQRLLFIINKVPVEFICREENDVLLMFDKVVLFEWNNLKLPILPLKFAKKFYELTNRTEKVELIEKHLKS